MKKVTLLLIIVLYSSPVFAQKIKLTVVNNYQVASKPMIQLNQTAMNKDDVFVVPRGRRIHSRLNDTIFRSVQIQQIQTKIGDVIVTQLMQDWYYKNKMVAPEGSLVKGKITNTDNLLSTEVVFDTIIRPDNVSISIQTKPIIITPESQHPIRNMILGYNSQGNRVLIQSGVEFTIQILNDVIVTEYK